MVATSVDRVFTRAQSLSSASTTVQGAMEVLVRSIISETAAR